MMRLGIVAAILLSTTTYAGATTLVDAYPGSVCPPDVNTGCDIVGDPLKFDINNLSITISGAAGSDQTVRVQINTHYNFGDDSLSNFPGAIGTYLLSPGDLLFTRETAPGVQDPTGGMGGVYWGIALHQGDMLDPTANGTNPNNNPALALDGLITRFHLYRASYGNWATASQVLNNPSGANYRPNERVWIRNIAGDGNFNDYGVADALVGVNPGSDLLIDLTYILPWDGGGSEFVAFMSTPIGGLLSGDGAHIHYGSATCANDILDGNFQTGGDDPVPEPVSVLLFGSGLAGLVVWKRRRA